MYELHVYKLKNKKNFTTIDNTILRDKKVSLKAKALLCFMLSLPPDWDFSREGLIKCIKEGRTVVDTALKELEATGYLKITKTTKHGKFYVKYKFYEVPFEKYLTVSQKPNRKILNRKSATEKPTQINTNKINIESNKTNYRVDSEIINNIQTKINYNMLVEKHGQYDVDKIVMVIANIIMSDKEDEITKSIFNSLTSYHIEYSLEKAKAYSRRIKNYDAWIKKVLINIPPKETMRIRETDFTKHVESEDGW